MPYLVPGTAVRWAVVVLSIVAIPTLARSREATVREVTTELPGELSAGRSVAEEPIESAAPPIADLLARPEKASPLDDLVAAGQYWRLETARGPVHVWIPRGYDPATAETVVFVHGYNTDVDTMWSGARLPQQFALSGINAMFIAPEAPHAKVVPMVWPSLSALLHEVAAGTHEPLPRGRLVAVGHSGAYRTMVLWLANSALQTVVLLDAAYGELDRFAAWVRAASSHRLINIAFETQAYSEFMHRALPSTKRFDGLPSSGFPDEARTARVLYVRTAIGHWPLVTGGLALPLALRALEAPPVPDAPTDLPLGFGVD